MPNFTYSTDVDVDIEGSYEGNIPTSIDVEGGMGRTAGEILLNVYPFKSSSFFVCGGAYFGGGKLIKIKGHSDELAELIKEGQEVGIEIGNYRILYLANLHTSFLCNLIYPTFSRILLYSC